MALSHRSLMAALVAALALAAPTSALGHDAYVDQATGADASNDCSHKSNPCKNIVHGIDQAGDNDTVFVAGGSTYTGSFTLQDGKSLVHKNFGDASGKAILDNGSGTDPDIDVPSLVAGGFAGAGRVKGFTIRSEDIPIAAAAKVTIEHNRFDEDAEIPSEVEIAPDTSGAVKITKNTFADPTPLTGSGDQQFGIDDRSPKKVTISANDFRDLYEPVFVDGPGSRVTIDGNLFAGTHAISGHAPASVFIFDAKKGTVTDNRLRNPDESLLQTSGIVMDVPGSISRNLVVGSSGGISVDDTSKAVTLDSDAIVMPTGSATGLQVSDYDTPDAGLDANASNLTIWGPGEAIELQKTQIHLDSSILGGSGIKTFYSHDKCKITHSRGPHKGSGDHGCKDFQTKANPKLKSDDYHLKGSSPMIDAGNKHKPPHGAKDIDGDRRAIACGHGTARRDIGADEVKC
jgi:Right handed beta helix region